MLSEKSEDRSVRTRMARTGPALPLPQPADRSSHVHGRLPPVTKRCPLSIRLPVSYAAFCIPRREVYTRYAAARVGCPRVGEELAQAALGDLAMMWAEALQSASPAALSWSLLRSRIAARAPRDRGSGLHRVLPGDQADAVVLRYRVGLPLRQAADLMGINDSEMTAILRTALRRLADPSRVSLWHMRRY